MKQPVSPQLIAFAAVVLAVTVTFPALRNVVQLRREVRSLKRTVYTGDIVVRGGAAAFAVPDTLREAEVLRDVIGELAGDYPGRLGDLTLGPPQETGFGREMTFKVDGRASFPQVAARLAWLEGLWPLAHVTSVALERPEEGSGLDVRLGGRFEFRRRVPVVPDLASRADAPESGRNPFLFGAAPAATPSDIDDAAESVAPPVDDATPFPEYQGSMILDGAKVAFFDGKPYRPGDSVAGRLLIDIVDGRPVLSPKEVSE